MSDKVLRRYAPSGLCAIEPSAFGGEFAILCGSVEPFVRIGSIAVVSASGPLTYDGFFFESYGRILSSVRSALESDARSVVLHIHSPGGDVFGAFECARALRVAARKAGKPLIAFTDTQACSSGYALASAADEIVITDSATVGSVGVIATAVDTTRADSAMGVSFALITSGARKADGNPHVPLSEAARAAMQSRVDQLAGIFFELVKDHRDLDAAPLEASIMIGQRAVDARLADRIESWDSLLARLETDDAHNGITFTNAGASASESSTMADNEKDEKKDDARAALAAAAKAGDAKAARALKAYDEEPEKAADEEPEKKDDDKDNNKDKASAVGASVSAIATLETTLRTERERTAKLEARLDAADRAAFLATRPDLSPELVKSLEGMSLTQIKAVVNAVPKTGFRSQAVVTEQSPTQGDTQDSSGMKMSHNPELDAKFGIGAESLVPGSTYDPVTGVQSFGMVKKGSVK